MKADFKRGFVAFLGGVINPSKYGVFSAKTFKHSLMHALFPQKAVASTSPKEDCLNN